MSKNKTRLIVVIAAIVTIISTFCYAETETSQSNNNNAVTSPEAVTTSYDNNETNVTEDAHVHTTTSEEETTSDTPNYIDQDVYEGDLYLFDSDVVMDKLVDGNIFIFGNNVTITGQSSGNAFVFGNNVTFDKAYIQASVFVFGNNVKFNAVSTSLYCVAQNLSIDKQFGVYSDMYAACSNFDFDGIIGRNSFLTFDSINIRDNGIFYGDLNYTSNSEIEIPENSVEGNVQYTNIKLNEKSSNNLFDSLLNLVQFLILSIVIFFVVKLFTKAPTTKECSVMSHPFKTFGVGLLSIILIPIIAFALLISFVGVTSSLTLLLVFITLMILSKFIFSVALARYICINKKHKCIKELLLTLLFTLIICVLDLVPYIGSLFTTVFGILGLGVMIYTPLYKKYKCCKNKDQQVTVVEEKKDDKKDKTDAKSEEKTTETDDTTKDK